ncbi:hypothetical protein E2562_008269 [Oryza meyeriana var. granulata]|uniref:WAT1-related protein n=1 Tax=Oryza meyeriana var. granulata TaxID=110450 RepID=A0A6G1DEY7_9ORYZ|nr:hypothetical protein E2562_008269 [Oryza meyeriana var. granulata]
MAGGAGGGWWAERYGPCVGMVMVQWFYALVDMALKEAGWELRRHMAVGARAFALLFAASLASATGQYFYFQGLQLASPSIARATTNLAPGITFAIAAVIGFYFFIVSISGAAA